MQRIGLMWDSVSDNMGDVAIGLVLQRAFAKAKLPYHGIDPFQPEVSNVCSLVIGGGELIRTAGDPFYDVFRVPGRHILNTVGVLDGSDTAYLDEYRLVSVRTQADRTRLGRGDVVPCLTLLYDDYLERTEPVPDIPANSIGIHLHYGFQDQIEPLVAWLRKADIGPIVWLPITHYNADALLLGEIAAHVPHSIMLPPLPPDAVFRTIGKLKALVSSSLHASLFAYTQGIPTLGFRPVAKLTSFLEEREQGQSVFSSADDIAQALPTLMQTPPDLTRWRTQDQATCRQWLARVIAASEAALSEPEPSAHRTIHVMPANARYHTLEMTLHRETGAHIAQLTHSNLQAAELRSTITRLQDNLTALRSTVVVRLASKYLWPLSTWLRTLRDRLTGRARH